MQWRRHGDVGDGHLIIGQLNVQSLLSKLPDIRVDIDDQFSFDVFILSETWLSPNTPDRLISVSGYKIVRQDRPRRGRLASGHGGVAICVRESFETERLPTPVTNVPNSNLEIVWAAIRVGKHRRFIVGAAYRVPRNTVQQVTADLDDLEAQLQHMIAAHPGLTIIIGGDMNCCLIKAGSNTPGERLRALLDQHGMQVCNTRLPTYRPAGSLLDILATNRRDLVTRAGVTRCHYGTPHDITRLALRVTGTKRRAGTVIQRRCLARVDRGDFNRQLLNVDWSPIYTSAGPELKWSAFVQLFKPLLDAVAPVRRVPMRPPGAPPASDNTRHLLALRRTALSAGDRQEYKEINRLSRAAIRADCRRHLQEQLTKGGPNSMWRVLRPMIGSNKSQTPISGITADALNEYYVSVAPELAATVPAPSRPVHVRLPRVCAGGLRIQPISMETLWAIVQGLKPSGAECSDGFSVAMIQDFFPGFGHIVLDVVNASLETGRVPASWKHATITPIPKGKFAALDPSRTRPISILPAITKIAERAVQLQLTKYMETHHLLSEAQHGYRKRHSCETALHVVSDDILRAMDCGEIALWAMVDLSKCFDMVPHGKLIDKLSMCGIDPFWLDDYLSGHTQQVQVRNHEGHSVRSSVRSNSVGVYQGGSLSCILWCIFANDLCLHVPESVKIVQFADDTQIWTTGKKRDLPLLVNRLETALQRMFDWFCEHGMKVNETKTELMIMGTKQMLRGITGVDVRFNQAIISPSNHVRNLGVIFDRSLDFKPHVDQLVPKCTGMLLALNHVKHVIPIATLRRLITALVFPVLRYCMSVYGICNKAEVRRIQKVINFAARVLSGRRKYDSISDVVRMLGWLKADELITYHRVVTIHRLLTGDVPMPLVTTIGPTARHQHDHNTRTADLLSVPHIRTEAGRSRLCYSAVKAYNDIPMKPGMSLKTATRRHLLERRDS